MAEGHQGLPLEPAAMRIGATRRGINVAFAGHNRAADLGDRAMVAQGLRSALDCVSAAGIEFATLLTGLADGADLIAAGVWHEHGLGPIHAVHPFLDEALEGGHHAHAATWLDGAALQAAGRNPHLAQTRWLIQSADLLLVVWTGGRGRGAGGTADAVRMALEHDVPVLWVKPADPGRLRLIRPDHLDDDFGFLELLEQVKAEASPLVSPATPALLAELLAPLHAEPETRPGTRRQTWLDRAMIRTLWRTYDLFTRAIGGRAAADGEPHEPPPDLLEQGGFRTLTEAYLAADRDADRLAAVHRSQQILVLAAAIGAAALGSSPALWPGLKIYAVLAELVLALAALAISLGAARAERHERWGRARRLAEQLRLERAAWPLGLSTASSRRSGAGPIPREAWQLRRRAGLADGAYDADRVRRWGDWAMTELVAGQARYHHARGGLHHRIAHRIHCFETASFAVFLAALSIFALAYLVLHALGEDLPHWAAGMVVMTSIIVPAVGAASIALEATLGFADQSRRSLDLARRLEALADELGPAPSLERLQQAAKAAIRLQLSQEERWTDESFRRRLVRAG